MQYIKSVFDRQSVRMRHRELFSIKYKNIAKKVLALPVYKHDFEKEKVDNLDF